MSWNITVWSLSPAFPLKFHCVSWFPGFSDTSRIISLWSISAWATYRFWLTVRLTSCILFHGAAVVALSNRKRNWVLLRLKVGGRLHSAVSQNQWKMAFLSCRFFFSQGVSALCKINVVSETAIIKFIPAGLGRSSKTGGCVGYWLQLSEMVTSGRVVPIGRITWRSPLSIFGALWPISFACSLKWSLAKLSLQEPKWYKQQCVTLDAISCWDS